MDSDREAFCAILTSTPLRVVDAIVVLCGEDADERGNAAAQLLRQGVAPVIVCSGGKHEPPRWLGGEAMSGKIMARGIAPDRLLVENGSQNTYEQAMNVGALAVINEWHSLAIVASPYHIYRAMLTFIKALESAGEAGKIRLLAVAADHVPWWEPPPGMTETRLELLHTDLGKIETYADHCATWADGLAYLRLWEGVK